MLASFLKVPKTWRLKTLKIYVFDYPTVVGAYVHGTSALQTDRQTTYDSNTALCITCIVR